MSRDLFSALRSAGWFNPLAGYAIAYAGGGAIQKAAGFLLFMWLAHELSVEEYAYFGILFALQAGLAQFAGAGIAESVIGSLRSHAAMAERQGFLSAANGVFVTLASLSVVGATIIHVFFARPTLGGKADLAFVLAGGVFSAFFALQATLVRLDEQHKQALWLGVGTPLAGLAVAFGIFSIGGDVGSFYAGMAIGLLLAFALMRMLRAGHYGFTFGWSRTANVRAPMVPYLAIALLSWLGGYGNAYLVQGFFNTSDVAMFAFVYTLSSVMQLVATSINQVWSPRVFRLAHELPLRELEQQNRRFYKLQGVMLGAVGAAMLLVMPPLLDRLGGNLLAYRALNLELFLLLSAYAVSIPWWHTQNYFMTHGEGRALMQVVMVTSMIGFAVTLGLMVLIGVTGVYAGFLAQMLIRSLGTLYWARRRWDLHVAWAGPLAALIMLAIGGGAAHLLFHTPPA